MGTARKVLKKVAAKIEGTPGTYEAPDTLIPWTSFTLGRKYDLIKDESNIGVSFEGLPVQGVRKQEGELGGQLDVLTIPPILEAGFGYVSSGAYSLPVDKNEKSLTIVALDDVETYKYAGCYVKKLTISGKADGALEFKADVIGWTLETRNADAWPTITVNPGSRLRMLDGNGTGYMRLGDQADALSSGDNMGFSDFSLEIDWGFDNDFDNTGAGTLQPLSGQGNRPSALLKATLARYSADTLNAWRDALTALQAEFYFYLSAAASLKIQFTNFVLSDSVIGTGNVANNELTAVLCRNGIGTSYSNANMAFVTPVKITLDNA